MSNPRRRAWRVMLSALAGGGLTAVGLGPLSGGALGAEVSAGSPSGAEGPAAPGSSGTGAGVQPAGAGAPQGGAGQSPTTTITISEPSRAPKRPKASPHASAGTPPAAEAPIVVVEAPAVVLKGKQRKTSGPTTGPNVTATHAQPTTGGANAANGAPSAANGTPSANNNVALAPQLIAAQASALAAELAGSAASAQALAYYRIPLFLLPIYQAAAVQYGVPWQILAAINEIETNYGSDQSVSSAGAVGWMQFMPATWIQYGVDALNAGYADPYNPIDAVFAAARYLNAAGASSDLRRAILAYNHSAEYVNSVLLRAKLISGYPKLVVATLTGLIDAGLPVTGKQLAWGALPPAAAYSPSSATAHATALPTAAATRAPATPGSAALLSPAAAAAVATGAASLTAQAPQLVDLLSVRDAAVVAVQDGRILQLGNSRKLGKYVVLRDIYGDEFTYAGLGSIAPRYTPPKAPSAAVKPQLQAAANPPTSAQGQAGNLPASSAGQLPLTLKVAAPKPSKVAHPTRGATSSVPASSDSATFTTAGKVRLFAHPGNLDAVAAAVRTAVAGVSAGRSHKAGQSLPLRVGSVVSEGTVLGHVRVPPGAQDGHLRFAIRPSGDPNTIDPRAILANWKQLKAALHPQGAKGESSLLGATASDVFLLSKSQLERDILSDPGIAMPACARHEVASGAIDRRMLGVLAFLSRSGLKPTIGTLRCGAGAYDVAGYAFADHLGDAVAITHVNGLAIAGHQGSRSITDTAIRALLTLRGGFAPRHIVSLMRYPGAPSTLARADHGDYIEIDFAPAIAQGPALKPALSKIARSAAHGATAAPPLPGGVELTAAQWDQLITRIAALPAPHVAVKPSAAAIPDPKTP